VLERLLLVAAGGAIGSVLRYLVTLAASRVFGQAARAAQSAEAAHAAHAASAAQGGLPFPGGTLVVNLAGCFCIALVHSLALAATRISPETRVFLTTGVMGGLTTYSSFNYETLELARGGQVAAAGANVALTLVGCGLAGVAGLVVAARLTEG
jgi:fluoride exporter